MPEQAIVTGPVWALFYDPDTDRFTLSTRDGESVSFAAVEAPPIAEALAHRTHASTSMTDVDDRLMVAEAWSRLDGGDDRR